MADYTRPLLTVAVQGYGFITFSSSAAAEQAMLQVRSWLVSVLVVMYGTLLCHACAAATRIQPKHLCQLPHSLFIVCHQHANQHDVLEQLSIYLTGWWDFLCPGLCIVDTHGRLMPCCRLPPHMWQLNNYPLAGGAIHVAYSTSATARVRQQALQQARARAATMAGEQHALNT